MLHFIIDFIDSDYKYPIIVLFVFSMYSMIIGVPNYNNKKCYKECEIKKLDFNKGLDFEINKGVLGGEIN